jgi:hypothetical protein
MQRLSSLGRQLWIGAQLSAPPLLQRAIIAPLLANKESIRSLLRPFFDVYEFQGQNQAGTLTASYIGTNTSLRFLRKKLFEGDSTKTKVGQIPIWQIHKLAHLPDCDVVIIEAGKQLVNRLPWEKAMVLPSYVHMQVDIRGPWADVRKRFGKGALDDLRLTRKYGYTYRVTHSWQDFDQFYDEMYVPTMKDRHGEYNSPMSKSVAFAYFSRGILLLLEKHGKSIAGGISCPQQKMLKYVLMGILNADARLIKEGAIGALTNLSMQWANREGFETFNFLVTEPYLNSGIFQWKRKWGSRVTIPVSDNKRIWIKIRRHTSAVAQFLKENPAIIVDTDDALHGLIITDNPTDVRAEDKEEWQKKYATPGLNSLLIRSPADFIDAQELDQPKS